MPVVTNALCALFDQFCASYQSERARKSNATVILCGWLVNRMAFPTVESHLSCWLHGRINVLIKPTQSGIMQIKVDKRQKAVFTFTPKLLDRPQICGCGYDDRGCADLTQHGAPAAIENGLGSLLQPSSPQAFFPPGHEHHSRISIL
jgi:hypothetical protein